MICQWIAGYRGLIHLARESKYINTVPAHVVYQGDEFDYQLGTERYITHKPDYSNAKRESKGVTHVYAVAFDKDGKVFDFEVMSKAQVDEIEAKVKSKKVWGPHWDEQARKTVQRRLAKRLPMSPAMALAVDLDNKASVGETVLHDTVVEAIEHESKSATENLADGLAEQAGVATEVIPEDGDFIKLIDKYVPLKTHSEDFERLRFEYSSEVVGELNDEERLRAISELERELMEMPDAVVPKKKKRAETKEG